MSKERRGSLGMPKNIGKEEIHAGYNNSCSNRGWSAGSRRTDNHYLPQEAEN
jgi:hypothetical protein